MVFSPCSGLKLVSWGWMESTIHRDTSPNEAVAHILRLVNLHLDAHNLADECIPKRQAKANADHLAPLSRPITPSQTTPVTAWEVETLHSTTNQAPSITTSHSHTHRQLDRGFLSPQKHGVVSWAVQTLPSEIMTHLRSDLRPSRSRMQWEGCGDGLAREVSRRTPGEAAQARGESVQSQGVEDGNPSTAPE